MLNKNILIFAIAGFVMAGGVLALVANRHESLPNQASDTAVPAIASTAESASETDTTSAKIEIKIISHEGWPQGLLIEDDGSMLVADSFNKSIMRILPDKSPEILVGRSPVADVAGVPIGGYSDGVLNEAAFESPFAIVKHGNGYMVSDPKNSVIRFFDKNNVKTAVSKEAGLSNPTGLAADENGNLYIADTDNNVIKKLDSSGKLTVFAGSREGCSDGMASKAEFRYPMGLYYSDGALYVADSGNHRICMIYKGEVSTIAGKKLDAISENGGFVDGPCDTAEFSVPRGVAVSANGDIYVADTGNSAVRKISGGMVTTTIKLDETTSATYPIMPVGIAIKNNIVYVSDLFAGIIFAFEN